MTIAIHQPNLCPRAAYFEKMAQSDLFVTLGHCQFSDTVYQHRFRADNSWFTMSVKHRGYGGLITEKKYDRPHEDWTRIKKSWPKLEIFDSHISDSLYLMNIHIIHHAKVLLGVKTEIVHDYETHLRGTDRLIDICKTYGATKYLSGISGKNYLDFKLFEQEEIEVIFQDEKKMDKRALVEVL